ncbi:MAG: hypothetical protein ACI9J2_000674 [Saprospiraceae bacterium]
MGVIHSVVPYIKALTKPVSNNKRALLKQRWNELPERLKQPNQMVGRHWVQCGYTLGPSYCSFGCSHCYLPKAANKVPLVSLSQMKRQIEAQRKLMGEGGNLQITGDDVVDAYFHAGRPDELIEVLQYATKLGLVPMLMTHGQVLLEQPAYFERLVLEGGLRKLSIHIDITMAGRAGYPIKQLSNEKLLNPLRDQFVDLVLAVRKKTSKSLVGAQTVTVVEKNIDSIGDILKWLMARPENMDVCRTISFQTEANIGRTVIGGEAVTPNRVWAKVCAAIGQNLPRQHLLFGHEDCSSVANVLVRPSDQKVVNLSSETQLGKRFLNSALHTFGGLESKSITPIKSKFQKLGIMLRRPNVAFWGLLYLLELLITSKASIGFFSSLLKGEARGFNIVMHNFMHGDELKQPQSENVQQRIKACAFKGVAEIEGQWQAVSMCEMNANMRPQIYNQARLDGADNALSVRTS